MRETWEEETAEEIILEENGTIFQAEPAPEAAGPVEPGEDTSGLTEDGGVSRGTFTFPGTPASTEPAAPEAASPAPQPCAAQAPAPDVAISMETVAGFEAMQRVAKLYLASSFVGDLFRKEGPVGVANATVALEIARRLNMPPLFVMQNMYLVSGKVGWTAQFLIASFNATGRFTPIRYQMAGSPGEDGFGCRALATEIATGFDHQGPLVTIGMAKAEGWFKGPVSKWKTMPELMLRYRAAAFLIRTCAPEVAMGLYTAEELQDVAAAEAGRREMKMVNWETSPWNGKH